MRNKMEDYCNIYKKDRFQRQKKMALLLLSIIGVCALIYLLFPARIAYALLAFGGFIWVMQSHMYLRENDELHIKKMFSGIAEYYGWKITERYFSNPEFQKSLFFSKKINVFFFSQKYIPHVIWNYPVTADEPEICMSYISCGYTSDRKTAGPNSEVTGSIYFSGFFVSIAINENIDGYLQILPYPYSARVKRQSLMKSKPPLPLFKEDVDDSIWYYTDSNIANNIMKKYTTIFKVLNQAVPNTLCSMNDQTLYLLIPYNERLLVPFRAANYHKNSEKCENIVALISKVQKMITATAGFNLNE